MRARCGVVHGDILDVINSRSKEEQAKAYAIIAEIEEQVRRIHLSSSAQHTCNHDLFVHQHFNLRSLFIAIRR